MVRETVDTVVNAPLFNFLLLTASFSHMILIAMNTCHGKKGEDDAFCGKAWINCKVQAGLTFYSPFADETLCQLRLCLEAGCAQISKSFDDRPLYADILHQANFSMRWVYTGVTALRMIGNGLILREGAFFRSLWSFLDFIIVIAAWLNDPYQFGNLMFIMVLRGIKLLMESSTPLFITPRVQLKAIGMGVFKVFLVFVLLNFIMGFASLLAMSLIGSKGDFHNRCAVPLRTELPDGTTQFTYEPIVPEVACRMNHLWDANVDACYGDVWNGGIDFVPSRKSPNISQPGCRGTCSTNRFLDETFLGRELDLSVWGTDKFGNPLQGDGVYCIGPDFEPLDRIPVPPKTVNGEDMKNYIPANISDWPSFNNNDERNFDNIGQSAIVFYTIFYRTAWTETLRPAVAVGGHAIILGWILLMIFTSYYLLNITVSITCSHYSEATTSESLRMEAIKAAQQMPTFDDDPVPEEGDDGAEQDLDGMEDDQNIRERLVKEMGQPGYPWCGQGCDCCTMAGNWINMGCNKLGTILKQKYAIISKLNCDKACISCQKAIGGVFKSCCHQLIKISIYLNFPAKEEEVEEQKVSLNDSPEKSKGSRLFQGSIVSRISVICMFFVMVTQGLQNSNISLFKCECSDTDIDQMTRFTELDMCTDGSCPDGFSCLYERCIKNGPPGYPCYNPRFNHKVALISAMYEQMALDGDAVAGEKVIPQPAADEWASERKQWCTFGQALHFALYGWAVIFLLELMVRYLGHQGAINFFTMKLYPTPENPEGIHLSIPNPLTLFKKSIRVQVYPIPNGGKEGTGTRLNFRNIIDSLCILATVAGIVLTELTFSAEQALLSGVSFFDPKGGGTVSPGSLPWIFKLLRLATLIRLAIRIPAIAEIPAVAVILRGFRGAEKVAMGITFLILMIFFFALLGKEIFDYGYVMMSGQFDALYNFSDIQSSMLPLLEIMIGSGWYDYAKAGIASLGIRGFMYFLLFYFVVNFQFLRIFIAIIVQNYELTEEEKLEAQKLILYQNFEKLELNPKEKAKYMNWDNFSFNKHYSNLLRGAQITLRKLEGYQRQLKEDGPMGFNEANEKELAGESDDDDAGKPAKKTDDDEGDKVLEQLKRIKKRLNINPQDWQEKPLKDEDEQVSIVQRIREKLVQFVKSPGFNLFVMIVVIISTVLAVYTTLDEDSGVEGLSDLISVILLGFFTAEMAVKMMAYGFFTVSPAGYFKRGWCILDFVLVLLQLVDVLITLFPDTFQLGDSADIFKGFRAIRIARLLARLQNIRAEKNPLKVVLQALGASLPAVVILLVAVIFMMFVFALVGIDQYAGLLYRCVTENPLDLTGSKCTVDTDCFPGYLGQCGFDPAEGGAYTFCTMDKMHCFGMKVAVPTSWENVNWKSVADEAFEFPVPRTWAKTRLTFDEMGSALFTMFNLINKSRIRDMLLQILSVTQRDQAPIQNINGAAGVYIIVLIIVVGIFVSQVVIGLIMTNLRLKSGLAFHTKEQLVWPATKDAFEFMPTPFVSKQLTLEDVEKVENQFLKMLLRLQIKFQKIQRSWKFDWLMMITVSFNCSLLAVLYFDMPGDLQVIYFWGGFACFVLYVFEFVVKTGADAKSYFMNPADQFDIFLTLLNAFDLFVFPRYNVDLGLGSLRMFRLFRLFNRLDTFVRLLETIRKSFPQAVAAVVLTFMVIFISSAIATRMFTFVKEGNELDSTFNNFSTFLLSMIAMFRVSSGAGWGGVIDDAGISAPLCTPKYWTPYYSASADENNPAELLQSFGPWKNDDMFPEPRSDCGLGVGSYAFFLLFVFINNYIILPTFVASIIASYFEANLKEHSLVKSHELVVFRDCWKEVGDKIETGPGGLPRSIFQFDRNPDKAQAAKNPYSFDRFDALLSLLQMHNSRLGFSKAGNPDKYKNAIARMKKRANDDPKAPLKIGYKTMAVMLLSISEKSRPVTIVDMLRREKAVQMLKEEGRKPVPARKKTKAGKQHAAIGIPEPERDEDGEPIKKRGLKEEDVVFSYNIYVVLDQLERLEDDTYKLIQVEHENLKKLVNDNDEDLFIYFEEYVEKSGPVFQPSGDAWRAFTRFAKKAKELYARSEYNVNKKKTGDEHKEEKEDGEPEEEEEEEEEEGSVVIDHEDEEAEGGDEDEEEDDGDEGPRKVSKKSRVQYGEILEDNGGTLDLRNWQACTLCGEPVDKTWDRCPNCGRVQNKK